MLLFFIYALIVLHNISFGFGEIGGNVGGGGQGGGQTAPRRYEKSAAQKKLWAALCVISDFYYMTAELIIPLCKANYTTC